MQRVTPLQNNTRRRGRHDDGTRGEWLMTPETKTKQGEKSRNTMGDRKENNAGERKNEEITWSLRGGGWGQRKRRRWDLAGELVMGGFMTSNNGGKATNKGPVKSFGRPEAQPRNTRGGIVNRWIDSDTQTNWQRWKCSAPHRQGV